MRRPNSAANRLTDGRLVWCLPLVTILWLLLPAPTSAATIDVQLTIQPKPCVVDVVQDGTQSAVQTQSADCDGLLPDLLTPVYGQKPQLPIIDTNSDLVARPRFLPDQSWSPIASAIATGAPSQQRIETTLAIAGGVGAVMGVAAFGVDAALFDMRHSRHATRWVKSRIRPS